jgi:antagonist of KipI
MAAIHVVSPGLVTTIQDLGRWGLQARGVPVAGPMDPYAHRMANALAGNPADRATLEVTLVGPEVEFDDARVVAVAGASFDLTLDDVPMSMLTPVGVAAGSRLKFGRRRNGARAYLAVSGGISVAPVLGSRATHATIGMGGIDGRPLKAGDVLALGLENPGVRHGRRRVKSEAVGADAKRPHGGPDSRLPASAECLRVLPGPQRDMFDDGAMRVLQETRYTVDPDSNRMAFRLSGGRLQRAAAGEMISDATPMGTIQVLPSGQPLLLMADRQTTGGYPQIATVISADFHVAGQLAPGDAVSFRLCTWNEAMAALIAQERVLLDAESRWTS